MFFFLHHSQAQTNSHFFLVFSLKECKWTCFNFDGKKSIFVF